MVAVSSASSRLRVDAKRTGDAPTDDSLFALASDLTTALQSPLVDARLIEVARQNGYTDGSFVRRHRYGSPSTLDVPLSAALWNSIPHRLKRELRGFLVVWRSANANVWAQPSTNPSNELILSCSADVTVRLVVF